MKRFTMLLVVLMLVMLTASGVSAQSLANYVFAASTGTYTPITGSTELIPANGTTDDDTYSSVFPLPWTVVMNGVKYTYFIANVNGFIRLGQNNLVSSSNPTSLSSSYSNAIGTASNTQLITPMWDDLYKLGNSSDHVHYVVTGTPGTRTLTVEWFNIKRNGSSGVAQNFQIQIDEATSVIRFVYGTCAAPTGTSCSVGFTDNVGGINHFVSITDPSSAPKNLTTSATTSTTVAQDAIDGTATVSGLTYTFTPPATNPAAPINITFSSVGRTAFTVGWTDNSTTEAAFTVSRATALAGPYTVVATVPSTSVGTTGTTYSVNQTGLLASTTYYYNIEAVDEGSASADLSGSQLTAAGPTGPLSGPYTINLNGADAGSNFISLGEAFSFLNLFGVSGPTTFTVTGTAATVTYPEANLTLGGAYVGGVPQSALLTTLNSTNTLTFVADAGKTINISGAGVGTTDYAFRLMGVDYVTFDGINVVDTTVATAQTRRYEFGYVIQNASNSDGATNNTIKNFSVILVKAADNAAQLTYGVAVGNGTTMLSSFGVAGSYASRNNYNKIQNFFVQYARRGVVFNGLAIPAADEGNEVSGPVFTSATGGVWVGGSRVTSYGGSSSGTDYGVGLDGQKNMKVFNVQVDSCTGFGSTTATVGIHVGFNAAGTAGADNVEIYNNVIHNLQNNFSLSSGVTGIRATGADLNILKIYNNLIYDLRAPLANAANVVAGLNINGPAAGSKLEVYNNSINLTSPGAAASIWKGINAFGTAGVVLVVKNNAFSITGGDSSRIYEFAASSPTLLDFSNNVMNVGTPVLRRRMVATWGAAAPANSRTTLIDWQSALATPSDGVDQRSAYGDPGFNSATDLTYGATNGVNNVGVPISGLSTPNDILGVPRSLTAPDAGAFEGDFSAGFVDAAVPGISITPLEGSVSSEIRVIIKDNVTPGMTARLWYRLVSAAPNGAFSEFGPDLAPADSGNGEYRWGASLRTLAAGLYQYYIVARDVAGNSFADPTMVSGSTSPGFTAVGDPNWAGANPFNPGVGVRTFQNAGATLAAGTYTVGATGTYTSLTAVAADVNTKPLTGNVVFELQPDYTSAGETFPIVFNQPSYASIPGPVTITIRPAATVVSELVTTGNPGGSNMLILLDGMRDLTLDGRPGGTGSSIMWRITNAKDSSASDARGEAIRMQNDALRNSFRYLKLQANCNAGTGAVFAILGTFNGGQGNNFNTVDHCDIGPFTAAVNAVPPNPVRGITSSSSATNVYNKNNTYTNNNIHDFHTTAGNPIGMVMGEVATTITGNSFYQTAPRRGITALAVGISIGAATGPGVNVSGNYFGGSAPNCGGAPWQMNSTSGIYAIQANVGSFSTPSFFNGNTMTNWIDTTTNATASSVISAFINVTTGTNQVPVSVSYNVIGNSSVDATTSPALTFLSASTAAPSILAGIFNSAGGVMNIVGNTIGGIALLSNSTGTSQLIGIQQQTAGAVSRLDSNLIGSLTTPNSIRQNTNAAVTGIAHTSTLTLSSPSVSFNTVANILYDATVAGSSEGFTGISFAGTAPAFIIGNTIRNIVGNNNGATIYGIYMTSTGLGTVIRSNTIRDFRIIPQTLTTSFTMYGINPAASTSTGVIEKNYIGNLINGSTSTSATLNGIYNGYGTNWTYSNNMISLGDSITTDVIVRGIYEYSSPPTTGAANLYYNSIRIAGSVTGGINNTYAFLNGDGSGGIKTFKNNIFVNTRTSTTGLTRGFAFGQTSSSSTPAIISSNYNVFKTANDTIALWLGTTTATNGKTLATWQAATGGDAASVAADPGFINPPADLHISPGSSVPGNNGTPIASVTTDFDGDARSMTTPDRGADEYTASAPLAFTLVYPADNAINIPINGNLLWNRSQFALSYDVYLGTTNPPALLASGVVDTFKTYALSPLVKNYWKVIANNGVGSVSSVVDSFTTAALPPATPTNLAFVVFVDSLQLTWTDNATNEEGYRVLRSTNSGGPFTQDGADLPVNTQAYTSTGRTPNTHYYYQVIAFNSIQGNSSPGTKDTTTFARTPGAPTFPSRTFTTITLALNGADNPAATQYAIQDSASSLYVSAAGTITSATEVWQSYTAWGGAAGKALTGLGFSTRYAFAAKAQNANNIQTAFGPQAGQSTKPAQTIPYVQTFDTTAFPPPDWSLVSGSGSYPVLRQTAIQANGISGPAARFYFYLESTGTKDTLTTPMFALASATNPALKFTHAKANYGDGSTDSLYVLMSTDAGTTWTGVLYGDGDPTLSTLITSSAFTPTAASQWRSNTFVVPPAFRTNSTMFAFYTVSGFGNNLWLDNVQVVDLPTVDYSMQSLVQIAGIPTPFRPVSITGNRASRSLTPAQKMSMAQTMVTLSSSATSQEPSVRNSKILTNYKKTSNGKLEVRGLEPVNIRSDARGGDNGNTIDGLSSLNGYTIVTNSGVTSPAYQVDWNLQGVPQTSVLRPAGIPFLGRDSVYLSTTPLDRGTITMDATANVPGDANPGDNTQVNNRVYVYPSPNVRIRYDNGANTPYTFIGFGTNNLPLTAGVRYTATQDMHIANVDVFYRNETSTDSVLIQVWAAGTTTSAPGAILYSKKFAGVNYISAGGDYFTVPLGDDAPVFASGTDFWLSASFSSTVQYPVGAHNSGFTTGHSYLSADGGATWSALTISSTEYAWILRAVGSPIPDTTAPVITYAPLSSTTSGGSIVLSATITDNKSVDSSVAGAPRLWYRSGPTIPLSGSYSSVSGARASAGSTTWNFTLPALSSITFVEYYVAAQDNALNVVSSPSGTGYTNTPPNAVVTTPNRFVVASPLTFTVGTAGANFPSITEGLTWFNGGINGPLQFLLNSDYTSVGEAYPIFIGGIPGLGTFADAVNASGRHQTGTKNTIAPNRMTGPEVATVNALPAFRPRIATMAMRARRIPGLGKSDRNALITNTFTIKPNTGATPGPISGTAPFSTTFAIIWIDAANGVTIDGLTLANGGDGPTVFISDGASHNRIINSTIKGVTQAGNAVGNIWFTDNVLPVNCTDNVIANCTLTDNGGGRPYAGAIFFSTAPVTDVNDTIRNCTIQNFGPANASGGEGIWAISSTTGLVIENNDFSFTTPGPGFAAASYAGIFVGSSATGLVTGTIVRNNTIHDIDVVTPSGLIAGISLGSGANVDGALAEGNTISNLAATGQATGSGVRGFYVAGGLNQVITRNTIKDLQNNIAGGAVLGLRISGAAGGQAFKTTWTNNMIVLGNVETNTNVGYLGISDNGNTDDTTIVAFNSIYIGGASTGGTTACYNRSAPSVATVENNIFMSERSGGVKNYGIRSTPATGGIFSSDYNDIYVTGATNGVFGAFAGVDEATLAAWQTATAGDAHSLNADPVFVDAISAEDLHIRTFVGDLSPVANVGVPYGGVTVDIDNEAGHRTTTPDIGADEFNMRAPVAFNMLTPVNGATEQPLAGSLTWDPTVGATVYDIFLDTNPAPVTLLAGNVVGTTTPYTGLATDLTYRWKVVAKNSDSSTTATGAPFHFATIVSTVNVSVSLGLGWNMIANPVTVTNDTVQHLYPTSAFNFAYFFVPSGPGAGYVKDTTMENGTGYWGKFPAAVAQTVSGLPRTRDSISVVAGWNMVGTISNPVDTSTIVSVPPGLKATHWYGFTPTGPTAGYNPATPLAPGLAYWIKANGAGKFVLANPVVTKPAKGQASGVDVKDVLNSLTITDSRGHAQTLYFGADASNQVPVAMYAMPPAPPIGVLDVRFATADGGSMVRTHAVKVSEALEFPVTIQSDAYPLTISWNVSKGTASYEMTDGAGGHVFLAKEMKGEGSMKITNTDLSRVSVRLLGDGTLPTEYALSQNYPNPFNPTTNIKYALPVQSKVMAEVYNLLGQRVRTLVNDDQPAGYHLVAWDGTGNGNEHLASGTYFLRLSATGTNGKTFTEVRKLLMLK